MVSPNVGLNELEGGVWDLQTQPIHAMRLLYHVDDVGMQVDPELAVRFLENWD